MNRRLLIFTGAVVLATVLVVVLGRGLAGPNRAEGVLLGATIGGVFQLLTFGLVLATLSRQPVLAFGLGMMGRFVLVLFAALVIVPLSGLPAGPLLLSMVSVLFATTLLEPVFLATAAPAKADDR